MGGQVGRPDARLALYGDRPAGDSSGFEFSGCMKGGQNVPVFDGPAVLNSDAGAVGGTAE